MKRTAVMTYIEYWVIRVVQDRNGNKSVIKEIEYQEPPTKNDIVEVLLGCKSDEFISVVHNYRMDRG